MDQKENIELMSKIKDFFKKKNVIVVLSIITVLLISTLIYNLSINKEPILDNTSSVKETNEIEEPNNEEDNFELEVNKMSGNKIEDFDFSFLQLENKKENIVYSPLSIKYALKMLEEGSAGNSKEQISNLIGNYMTKKYTNSSNMSIANALFIRDAIKKNINNNYISILEDKYNAEIIYDSFVNTNELDSWTKNKTFGLIDKLFDDISHNDFILVNALAIDMEWKNLIQSTYEKGIVYRVYYYHEDFGAYISELDGYYPSLDFNNNLINAEAVEIGASINNYDIITELGENNIREKVGNEYEKWLARGCCEEGCEKEPSVNEYLDKYISELASNYKRVDFSTDFLFHSDDDVKVFAKDLKKYNGTTLQYVGIMPKKVELDKYVKEINSSNIINIIDKLKTIELKNFNQGKITEIKGHIPLFKFDYELEFIEDLKRIGVTDIFDMEKANLSGITSVEETYINQATHKASIEFSNEGIKAAAVTPEGGYGADNCNFEYLYDVPVETIDLTFDKPYLFLIRDKFSGEVWFVGTVYEPNINNYN